MKESLRNRKFWFAQAIMNPYWFEYVFDDHIYSHAFDLDFDSMCSAILNEKTHWSAKQLIEQKLCDLENYTTLVQYFLFLSTLLMYYSDCSKLSDASSKGLEYRSLDIDNVATHIT